jgi:hypothetical protein
MLINNKIPIGVWIFHAVWASAVAVGISAYSLRSSPDRIGLLQTVVLAITLLVLSFYTYYTKQMQNAMVKQTNVSILPVFEIQLLREGESDPWVGLPGAIADKSWFILKNIGNGTALNIQIESRFVNVMGHLGMQNYLPVRFERVYSLARNQMTRVQDIQPFDVATARAEGERRLNLLGWLVGRDAWEDSDLKIWFTDILGNQYVQVVHLGRQGIWPDVVRPDDGQIKRTEITYNQVRW